MILREHRRKPQGLADLLNWAALVGDGIVVNKDGSFLAGWSYTGPDLDAKPVLSGTMCTRCHLITRRSQVQILPPPPIGPGHGTCPDQGRFATGGLLP